MAKVKFDPTPKEEVEYETKFSAEFDGIPDLISLISDDKEFLKEDIDQYVYEIQRMIDIPDDKLFKIAFILKNLDLAISKCSSKVEDKSILNVHTALCNCRDIELEYFHRFTYASRYASFISTMGLANKALLMAHFWLVKKSRTVESRRCNKRFLSRMSYALILIAGMREDADEKQLISSVNKTLRYVKGLQDPLGRDTNATVDSIEELVTICIYILRGRLLDTTQK